MAKPTVNGRASICTWDLRAEFKTKDQAREAIKKILDLEIDIEVSFEKNMLEVGETYCVIINDTPWADNLLSVAKILKSVDWDDE